MTSLVISLLKSLLIEGVVRSVAIAALKSGIRLARLGASKTSNKVDDIMVDGLDEAAQVVIKTWNQK